MVIPALLARIAPVRLFFRFFSRLSGFSFSPGNVLFTVVSSLGQISSEVVPDNVARVKW
jgi:hypothetical protein